MPKNSQFKVVLKTAFRKNLNEVVEKNIKKASDTIKGKISEKMYELAKDRLYSYNNASEESLEIIDRLVENNITLSKVSGLVRIKMDPEGLMMFLEYGTGLVGESDPHPEASRDGWSYATRKGVKGHYKNINDRLGFLFYNTGTNYIDNDDITPVKFKPLKKRRGTWYIRRNPKTGRRNVYVKSYVRRKPKEQSTERTKENLVFSEGIYPVRYIYETKQKIRKFLKNHKGETYSTFLKNINNELKTY